MLSASLDRMGVFIGVYFPVPLISPLFTMTANPSAPTTELNGRCFRHVDRSLCGSRTRLDLRQRAGICRQTQIIIVLQVQPKLRRQAKIDAQPERGIAEMARLPRTMSFTRGIGTHNSLASR